MQDQLEHFIKENRNEFNDADPNPEIWTKIERSMDKPQRSIIKQIWTYTRVGIAAILILGIGVWTGTQITSSDGNSDMALQNFSPELAEVEQYYVHQINYKLSLIKGKPAAGIVTEDLQVLDTQFKALKSEMGEGVSNEMIIRSLIENYQTKIKILERVLSRLEKSEEEKPMKNENTNI